MKRILFSTLLFLIALPLLTQPAHAQTQQHGIQLTWNDTDTAFGTLTYNVYRLIGACPTVASFTSFTKITTTPISAENYFDPIPAAIGSTVCYEVSAIGNQIESNPSNPSSAVFLPPPFPPVLAPPVVK